MTMRVTNSLQDHRVKRKLTQEQLGQAVGVTRQTIISIEKGNYTPSVLLALKLARFFHTKVDTVFAIEEKI